MKMYPRSNAMLSAGIDRQRSSSICKPLMTKGEIEILKVELTKRIQEGVVLALQSALGVSGGLEKPTISNISSKPNTSASGSNSTSLSQVQQKAWQTAGGQRRQSKLIKPVVVPERPAFGANRLASKSPLPYGQRKSLFAPSRVKRVAVYPLRPPVQPKQLPLFPDNISEIGRLVEPSDNRLEDFAVAVEKLRELGQPMLPPVLQGIFDQLRTPAISDYEEDKNPLKDVQHLFKTVHTGTDSRSSYPGSLDSEFVVADSQLRKAQKLNEDIRNAAARRSGVPNPLSTPSRHSLSFERRLLRRASRPADLFI